MRRGSTRAALAAAGIDRATPDPFGGRIVRDAAGEPTGLLLERAVELMTPHLPEPPAEVLDAAILDAQAEAHRLGLTGIHDVETDAVLDAFRRLERAGVLRLRVLFHPPVASLPSLVAARRPERGRLRVAPHRGREAVPRRQPGQPDRLDAGAVRRDPRPRPRRSRARPTRRSRSGPPPRPESRRRCTPSATPRCAGRSTCWPPRPRLGVPHRIEHFQCVSDADLEPRGRCRASSLPCSRPICSPTCRWSSGTGAGAGRGAYAFRTLRRHGTTLAFGSDVPVASLDPREGLYAALARRDASGGPAGGWRPEERLGFDEAVRAYTVGPAVAGGVAARSGVLAPGCDADLVAWSFDAAVERGRWRRRPRRLCAAHRGRRRGRDAAVTGRH